MTQPQWSSLFTPAGAGRDTLSQAVASALTAAGAIRYDPFGTMPGLSYPRATKLFIAPSAGTWLRLIPSPDSILEPVVAAASAGTILVYAEISADLKPLLTVYADAQSVDAVAALKPYLFDAEGFSAHLNSPKTGASGIGGISSGVLPQNVRAMSSGLPARQVERLMSTMTGGLSKNERAGAQAALQSVEWGSGAGGWMAALLAYAGLDDHVSLEYSTVSTAYRTAKRLSRNPNATLYPGDAEARESVPDALDYVPVFYGWKA